MSNALCSAATCKLVVHGFFLNSTEMHTAISSVVMECALRSDDELWFVIKRASGI